jgi:prepilin-type N-terminal cleavage/methylation domain-containing protein
MKKENGFTLVELAIVLMIIGLLIGGVLRGQELLANSQTTATMQQVAAYIGAKVTFGDAYGAIPGDMPNATKRVPGCTSANSCQDGNGDGVIGGSGSQIVNGQVSGQPWTDVDPAITTENTQFWKHLAAAHMISGVDPSASTPEWGKSHPVAKMGSGFFARYANFTGVGNNVGSGSNIYLVLRKGIDGTWQCGGGANPSSLCSISGMRASQIDRKMDDSMAGTGDVIAVSSSWQNGCGVPNLGINGPTGYAESKSDKSCDIMFKVK